MHGQGEYRWVTGDRYSGVFKRDRRYGRGSLTLSTGEVIEGEWIDDRKVG